MRNRCDFQWICCIYTLTAWERINLTCCTRKREEHPMPSREGCGVNWGWNSAVCLWAETDVVDKVRSRWEEVIWTTKQVRSQRDCSTYNSGYFTGCLSVVLLRVTVDAKFLNFKLNKRKQTTTIYSKHRLTLNGYHQGHRTYKLLNGVILQHLVQFYQCFETNEVELLLYNG